MPKLKGLIAKLKDRRDSSELHDGEDYYLRVCLIPKFLEDEQEPNCFEESLLEKKLLKLGNAIGTRYLYTTWKGARLLGFSKKVYDEHRQGSLRLWEQLEANYKKL